MTIEQMRQALLTANYSPHWIASVKKMSDGQVFVIYMRLKNANKI